MKKNNVKRITESQLKAIIKESVKRVLRENYDLWDDDDTGSEIVVPYETLMDYVTDGLKSIKDNGQINRYRSFIRNDARYFMSRENGEYLVDVTPQNVIVGSKGTKLRIENCDYELLDMVYATLEEYFEDYQ